LPNVVVTDSEGCGYKKMKVRVCPKRSCEPGMESCSAYISLFYHWDDQIYGGAPDNALAGLPSGLLGANQMVWPMSGDILQSPSSVFKESDNNRCGLK